MGTLGPEPRDTAYLQQQQKDYAYGYEQYLNSSQLNDDLYAYNIMQHTGDLSGATDIDFSALSPYFKNYLSDQNKSTGNLSNSGPSNEMNLPTANLDVPQSWDTMNFDGVTL
jgi:hypothetical protein